MKKVAVVIGSDSDLPVIEPAIKTLEEFDIPHSLQIMSAHRTPKDISAFAESARENEIGVIIAAAGKAAHLAGVIASYTLIPIIGVPVKSSTLDGLDALLSTVQMPGGVPVATVAIDGAKNAALLAIEMLAINDEALYKKLVAHREKQSEEVRSKNKLIK